MSAAESLRARDSTTRRGVDAAHPVTQWRGAGQLTRPARRIVSLLPSATEIVCALGVADRLLAVTHECDFPAETLSSLPRVTSNLLDGDLRRSRDIDAAVRSAVSGGHGLYALDDALMADLRPDLILTQELCHVCAVSYPTVLESARAIGGDDGPLVVSLEPHTMADVFATIGLIARLAGVERRGEALVAELWRRIGAVQRPASRPRVAVIEWLDPLFAPGHWVPEQVQLAGGEAVIGDAAQPSREVGWDAVAEANPDVVVLGLCGFDLGRSVEEWRSFEPPPELTRTAAWRDRQVWAVDGSAYVSRPGPRLVDGVEVLGSILHGTTDARAARLR